MITGVEDEGEIRTEERKEICAGATLMATHTYTRNPESPLGKEIDLQQWDTLIFKGEHAENEHWRLVEDRHGQVGYAPAAFLVIILDTAAEKEESDARIRIRIRNSLFSPLASRNQCIYELNNIYKRTMGRETPIETVISVATMEATQQKENKHNVASDYQIKH